LMLPLGRWVKANALSKNAAHESGSGAGVLSG
jgi:hypothetical protein